MSLKVALYILNTIFTISGLVLASASVGFVVFINIFRSPPPSHYTEPDDTLYWLKVLPWVFFVASLFVILPFYCGCKGAKKYSKPLITRYAIFVSVATVLLISMAIVTIVYDDGPRNYNSIRDVIWDAFSQVRDNPEAESYFGDIEKNLYCCGAASPRDYLSYRNEYPPSCCEYIWRGVFDHDDCDSTIPYANALPGCAYAAVKYASIGIQILYGVSFFTGFIGILTLSVAFKMSKTIKVLH